MCVNRTSTSCSSFRALIVRELPMIAEEKPFTPLERNTGNGSLAKRWSPMTTRMSMP
jgi:hypothetical protein